MPQEGWSLIMEKRQLIQAVDHHGQATFISLPALPVQKASKTGQMCLVYKVATGFHWTETAQYGTKPRPDQGLEGKEETLRLVVILWRNNHFCYRKPI